MANQVYFNGHFWQCVAAASAGESPATHPEKWRRIQIPKRLRRVLSRLTYGHLLDIDGQKDKSLKELGDARELLEDLVRQEANKEHWRTRPNVGGRC